MKQKKNFKKTRKNIIFIFRLNVKGQTEEILLDKESILDVRYISETPDDSNARATDLSVILEIKGKILAAAGGDTEDDTRKVAECILKF